MSQRPLAWYEQAFGGHYPLLYEHRSDEEARRCLDMLARLAPLGRGPVLDLGCGGGRHLAHLAHHGVPALGLDLSDSLLKLASERRETDSLGFGLIRGDMRWLPLLSESVTTVLSLFTAFGYFGGLEQHRGLIQEIVRVLAPGGHWFFDYFNCELVREELADGRPLDRVRELGPLRFCESRRLIDDPLRVVKDVQVAPLPDQLAAASEWQVPAAGLAYREEVALFSLAELERLTADCGLLSVAVAGGYDGEQFDARSSARWILVFGKTVPTEERSA